LRLKDTKKGNNMTIVLIVLMNCAVLFGYPPGTAAAGTGPVTLPVSTPEQSIDVPKQDIKLIT
jgi:hypothetical protein